MNTSLSLRNAPEDMPPQEIAHAITSALDGLKAVRTFVTNQFVEGVDYGKIPGCGDKPALLNPGAQKAVMYFNSYPTFKVKEKDLGAGHVDFRVRAILVSRVTLHQIGEGIGCASTKEKKFRRSAGSDMKKCPQCGKAAVLKSKDKPEYFCWRKKDGCGAVFALNHPAMKAAAAPAEDNDAPYEVRNTVLKMAKKRALVDAAMTLGCLAELFTQDIEDTYGADQVREAAQPYEGEVVEEPMPPTAPSGQPRPQNKGLSTKESIERTKEFLAYLKEECDAFQKRWAGQWEKRLDRALDEGKEVPSKLPELINSFQAKNHLIKWAKVTGRTRPGVDPGESRSREVEAYLAEIFYGDEADQAAVIQELGDYISLKRKDLTAQIFRQHPDLAPAGYAEELAEAEQAENPPAEVAPRNGKELFTYVKDFDLIHSFGIMKYLNAWGKLNDFAGRMVDWEEPEVALAFAEIKRHTKPFLGAKATAIANQTFDKVHDRHGEPEDRGDAYEGDESTAGE